MDRFLIGRIMPIADLRLDLRITLVWGKLISTFSGAVAIRRVAGKAIIL